MAALSGSHFLFELFPVVHPCLKAAASNYNHGYCYPGNGNDHFVVCCCYYKCYVFIIQCQLFTLH